MSEEQVQDRESQAADESEFAPAWRPEPGDRIEGRVLNVEPIDPNGRGVYPCVTLNTADGPVAVHAFHTVLRRELARRAPKVGDEVVILYKGRSPGGRGEEYHNYKVAGGQAQEYDWSQELPADERESRVASSDPPIEAAPLEKVVEPSAAEKARDRFGDSVPF